ncbi:NAD(P)-dependent dehydrogenase (short-subunit alcohol dehydrogenase family) [Murinocardiopsis flavida]|uniref:NAD(P)-dependent dehydrogenase (Short-subunit alcohol dehydrogenase family) n=1 Tax=Murinocardiopsis flavida TaxID=645275 RepID=A0A2P8DH09_9ACTN|nr:SDR family oxidoreductase [Murinocardiopsis flavida]PSK96504.1 NAD(P)-dependent dehydrogenase (short-subunit alcohol dehydrogenase family) [Murinocardiopsis flavida]
MPNSAVPRPLAGRAALVTGGSRGIGAAVALRLAADGADVALTYLSAADRAAEVVRGAEAAGVRGLAIAADAGDPAAVRAAVERAAEHFGRLDILVNNAGVAPFGPMDEVTVEEYDRVTAVHGRAAFLAAQAAAPHMGAGGRIITIGSNLGERVPAAGMTLYAMSKASLLGLTRGLARDLGPRGITANLVQPGSTDTEMNPAVSAEADAERALTALGRYCDPEDIAASVAHLAGPGGRSITGASLLVDAGANA